MDDTISYVIISLSGLKIRGSLNSNEKVPVVRLSQTLSKNGSDYIADIIGQRSRHRHLPAQKPIP
jgi:hypothetical protein